MLGLTIGETLILGAVALSFAIQIVGLILIVRDVRYVANIERAILLRTDRTEKAIGEVKAALQQ